MRRNDSALGTKMRRSSQSIRRGRVVALFLPAILAALPAQSAQRIVAATPQVSSTLSTSDAWLKQASQHILRGFDPVNGGVGNPNAGLKFPRVPALDLLLAETTQAQDDQARRALTRTLEAMAYGGIYDQLGGGFYRYAIEPTWTVPHFEKMLADNAQLLSLYTRSYVPTRTPFLRDVALHIARYLIRDMQAAEGGFYTAQNTEAGGVAPDLWTRAEITDELGPVDTLRFFAVYELVPMPKTRVPRDTSLTRPGAGVLRVRQPIEETVQRVGATDLISMQNALSLLRAELLARRKDRPQPETDERIVTSLNGLAIGALAQAGADLDHPDCVAAAEKAATRLWSVSFDPVAGLVRREIVRGHAETDGDVDDYAMLADGFLMLADAIRDDARTAEAWRWRAKVIADAMLARFGLAFDDPVAPDDEVDDGIPSARSAALAVLLRLGDQPDSTRFRNAAATLATAMNARIAARPQAWPCAVAALARHPIESLAAPAPRL